MKAEFTPRLFSTLRLGYDKATFRADLFAGITVGIVALPLAMAFAIASGVTPERGLITAIVAGCLISALGGSRVQIGGPTGAFVVIVYSIIEKHGYSGLVLATLMAGFILILFGLLRLGTMIKFIPYPVTTGFTSGIALIIFSSQIKDFFGLPISKLPSDFIPKWQAYFGHLNSVHLPTMFVGFGSLAILILLRRYKPTIPGPIVAAVMAALVVKYSELPIETIGTRFGGLPSKMPMPELPSFTYAMFEALIPSALTVALLAGIESLLSAVIADGMTSDRHNSNCELVAQGIANIASVGLGGIPATGAIARTATNIKAGAKTPVAGIIHSIALLFFMLYLAPLANAIPLCALSAILFVTAWNMSEIDHFRYILRSPRSDVAVLLTTFSLTVLVDLTLAVQIGIVLASLLFMRRMSESTDTISVAPVFQDEVFDFSQTQPPDALFRREVPEAVEVFQMQGPFFFGVADRVKDVLNSVQRKPKIFILRMRKVPTIDATGLHALDELMRKCKRQGIELLLSGVQPQVAKAFKKVGFWDKIGTKNICQNIDRALDRANQLLQPSKPEKP